MQPESFVNVNINIIKDWNQISNRGKQEGNFNCCLDKVEKKRNDKIIVPRDVIPSKPLIQLCWITGSQRTVMHRHSSLWNTHLNRIPHVSSCFFSSDHSQNDFSDESCFSGTSLFLDAVTLECSEGLRENLNRNYFTQPR